MKDSIIYYSVGALLYCPANSRSIADSVISERYGKKFSLALCLEDTIKEQHLREAEDILLHSLNSIYQAHRSRDFYLPKIFIRGRTPEQLCRLAERMGDRLELLSGCIAPKFSMENADGYLSAIADINRASGHKIYLMPILESPDIVNLQSRYPVLYELKSKMDAFGDMILNIRVGGNDLCHMFGLRRHASQSIHGIRPVDSILSDILTVYGMDYVVSGPVWEYYRGAQWETGLRKELEEELLCGFVGKTVIHPNQIAPVNDMLQVPLKDLEDARAILHWDEGSDRLVSGSISRERMNEYKTHSNWAVRTLFLAEYYGTR